MDKNKPTDKPDLKHDSMEFSAATDGDDILDTDTQAEPDEISAEELDALEEDSTDEQAEALNTVEQDRETDNEVIFGDDSDEKEGETYVPGD